MSALEEELDRLYQLPLSEFVKARNEIAAALKKNGDGDAAKRVRDLAKPSPSAWAVNQLYWRARTELTGLIAAGDRVREAQRAALSGDGSRLADAEGERRRAMEAALRRIRYVLAESGQAGSDSLVQRITTTLESIASYGSANPIPMRGRLTQDLDSPGFAVLSSLAPPPPSAEERLSKEILKDEEALSRARAALSKATARAELSAVALDEARAALTRASEEADRAASDVEEARARVAELEEIRRSRVTGSGEAAD
jgi:hypothetical protein